MKVNSACEPSGPDQAGAYPGFFNMKRLGVLLLPLGWDASLYSCSKVLYGSLKESRFPLFGIKDLARQVLISFTKHKRPISSEGFEVLHTANQLGLNTLESLVNSAWFYTILYFGKRGRENQRAIKPVDLQRKTTMGLKYKSVRSPSK